MSSLGITEERVPAATYFLQQPLRCRSSRQLYIAEMKKKPHKTDSKLQKTAKRAEGAEPELYCD